VLKKLREKRERKIGINLISPDCGVVVDGHHDFVVTKMDHSRITIVTASLDISEGLRGAGLLDHWAKQCDKFGYEFAEGNWEYYELFTGKPIPAKTLRKILDTYPDYNYSV
jgi:hypothetical protein